MLRKLLLIPLFLATACAVLPAQDSVLEQYVAEGLSSNHALKSREISISRSILQLQQARARFFPTVDFNANYTWARGGRTIDIPIGDLLNPVYSTLNQMIAEDRFPTLDNVSEQFLPNNFHETKLNLVQPLFNSDIYFAYKANQSAVAVEKAKRNAYENELVHEIRRAYFQHLQAREGKRIYEEARQVLVELKRVNEKLVENGKATPDALAQSRAELAKIDQELARSEELIATSSFYFNFLLNRSPEAEITIDSAYLKPDGNRLLPELATYSADARAELEALRQGMAAQQSLLDMQRYRAVLPDMYLAAQAGFQGFEYTFDENQDFWLIQVGLNWNLFGGGSRRYAKEEAAVQLSGLENDYAQLQRQLDLQMRQAWYTAQSSQASLAASRDQETAAREAFRIVRRRYQEGQALWLELIQSNNALIAARQARSIAHFDLLIAFESLQQSISNQ